MKAMTDEFLDHKAKIKVVGKLVKPSKIKSFWGREIKHLNDIIKAGFSDREFWEKHDMGFKVNSLAWFKSEKGKERLQGFYNSYLLKRAAKMEEIEV